MQTCVDGEKPAGVESAAFAAGLQQAQSYSDEIYGKDCLVCAQVLDQPEQYMLHITSPYEDGTAINTSAAITVRKSDGAVVAHAQWHSCYVRVRRK
jgi:hypothetical protein